MKKYGQVSHAWRLDETPPFLVQPIQKLKALHTGEIEMHFLCGKLWVFIFKAKFVRPKPRVCSCCNLHPWCEFFRCLIACGVTMEYNVGICWIIFGGQIERQVGSTLTQNTKKEAVDECNQCSQCNPDFLNSSVWELFWTWNMWGKFCFQSPVHRDRCTNSWCLWTSLHFCALILWVS